MEKNPNRVSSLQTPSTYLDVILTDEKAQITSLPDGNRDILYKIDRCEIVVSLVVKPKFLGLHIEPKILSVDMEFRTQISADSEISPPQKIYIPDYEEDDQEWNFRSTIMPRFKQNGIMEIKVKNVSICQETKCIILE